MGRGAGHPLADGPAGLLDPEPVEVPGAFRDFPRLQGGPAA
ncbi:hypothetical protein [Streptomyces dangxiongensis]|nr:hypothetical protein [Streptomyces dangxiongensis]